MAAPKAQDYGKFGLQCRRSNQEITTCEMGFDGQLALQKP
jgi:hypothetical protein